MFFCLPNHVFQLAHFIGEIAKSFYKPFRESFLSTFMTWQNCNVNWKGFLIRFSFAKEKKLLFWVYFLFFCFASCTQRNMLICQCDGLSVCCCIDRCISPWHFSNKAFLVIYKVTFNCNYVTTYIVFIHTWHVAYKINNKEHENMKRRERDSYTHDKTMKSKLLMCPVRCNLSWSVLIPLSILLGQQEICFS